MPCIDSVAVGYWKLLKLENNPILLNTFDSKFWLINMPYQKPNTKGFQLAAFQNVLPLKAKESNEFLFCSYPDHQSAFSQSHIIFMTFPRVVRFIFGPLIPNQKWTQRKNKKLWNPDQPVFLESRSFANFLSDFNSFSTSLVHQSFIKVFFGSLVPQDTTMTVILTPLTRVWNVFRTEFDNCTCFEDKFDVLHTFIVISCAFCFLFYVKHNLVYLSWL